MAVSEPRRQDGGRALGRSPARLRLAAVIHWRDLGRWIWAHLPEQEVEADLIFAAPEPGSFWARRPLPPYLGELFHLLRRRPRFDRYDVVFSWELRAALATGLIRQLTGQRRARWVALAPILKGPVLKALPLVRRLLGGADRIVCFSSGECEAYAELLRLPRERFAFLPLAWLDDEPETDEDDGYILALGHSNRDYNLLLKAVHGTGLPVRIVAADTAWLEGETPPPHVTIKTNTGFDETNALIAKATFHVIPLKPVGYSSGQTVLLRAMARGKAVVITDTMGVRDYVRDGETGVLVPPGDAEALRSALLRLWDDPARRKRIGTQAARAIREEFGFPRFARRLAQMARELVATPPADGTANRKGR